MEALGERGVAVDSLESLKQTHARETAKLAALTYAIAESLAGIHEKERHGSTMQHEIIVKRRFCPSTETWRGKDNDGDNRRYP
ncbi:hypothetical protein Tco_0539765 [Tanacetum coccineum]